MEKTVGPLAAEARTADRMFWLMLAAGLLLFAVVTITPGARHSRALQANVLNAEAVWQRFARTEDLLIERERALQSDPFYNEAVLRAKMKYTRPGEKEVAVTSTADRRLLVDMPRNPEYVPKPMRSEGLAGRISNWSLLFASGLLVAAAFIFFDRPAGRAETATAQG